MWDILRSNAFSLVSLTDAINRLPYRPGRIGAMGLFQAQGVTRNVIAIESQDGVLALLPTKRRGEPATVARRGGRTVRTFNVPHIPYDDRIYADELQNVRRFGSEDETEGIAMVINDRLAEMRQAHDVTLEYHRMGALHGVILDADGSSVIYNLFDEFGVTEQSVDFALDTATTDVRAKCLVAKRIIEESLGGLSYTSVHAFCGAEWFEAFIGHDYVRDAYHRYQDSTNLRNDPRAGFEFAGITFEEYRGSIGNVNFIKSDEARFFPIGVPQLFKTYFAPADFMETVNTVGLPYYAKTEPEAYNRGLRIHTQSNPLCICTRPRCLVKGT